MTQPINLPNTTPTNLSVRYGGQAELDLMIFRLATIYQIPESNIQQFPDIRSNLMVAAMWMHTYGALPQRHIYLLPKNQKFTRYEKGQEVTDYRLSYTPCDSFQWRAESVQQQADERQLIVRPDAEEIPPEQSKARFDRLGITDGVNGGPYHPDDVLYRVRLYVEDRNARPGSPLASKRQNGHSPNYPWHWGWWKRFAQLSRKEQKWLPDTVPFARSRDWVSLKRATRAAYAFEFELRPVKGWLQLDDRQRLRRIHEEIEQPTPSPTEEMYAAYPAPPTPLNEEPDPSDPTNPLTLSLYA